MTKTLFYDGITQVNAAFLNAINNPVYRSKPERDGEFPLISDSDLSVEPGQLLPSWKEFSEAFKVGVSERLSVAYNGGVYRVTGGTPTIVNPGRINLPDNSSTYVFLSLQGQVAQSSDFPALGKILARVTTVSGSVARIEDFRSRGILELSSESFLPSDSKLVGSVEALHGPSPASGWIEQKGMRWVSLVSDPIRSIGSPGSGAGLSEPWLIRLYTYLFNDDLLALTTASGTTVTSRPANATEAWNAKLRLALPDYRGEILSGASANARYGASVGSNTRKIAKNHLPNYALSVTDPGHAHSVSVTPHAHNVNTGAHSHGVYDAGHSHPGWTGGHAHAVHDPGHQHLIAVNDPTDNSAAQGFEGNTGPFRFWRNSGHAATGVAIHSVGDIGVGTHVVGTGISLYEAGNLGGRTDSRQDTIGIFASPSGLTVNLAGGAQDFDIRPASRAITWLIFAG